MNKNNEKLLRRYKMICKNKGLTMESIKAICECNIPVFLRFIGEKQLSEEVSHIDIKDFFDYCINERLNGDQFLSRKFSSLNFFAYHDKKRLS